MTSETIHLLPIYFEVDGVVAEILEILEHKFDERIIGYTVSMRIMYKGIKSRVFPLDCKDLKDLINKLKVEISKLKFMEIVLGLPELRRLIT
uniref:Uncharacterized protein n=1 Tax=Ignisphaera aggregans TaxID=334771 RepID=A0A7J3JQ20_9CREN